MISKILIICSVEIFYGMNVDEKSPDKRALTQDQYLMKLRISRTKEQEYRNQYLTVQLLTVNTKDSANPNERPGVH